MKHAIDRRRVLRGIAAGGGLATLGIPILETMLNDRGTAFASGELLPTRFGVWYWSGGIMHEHWNPTRTGPDFDLKRHLQPFAENKDYLTVATGYRHLSGGVPHISGRQIALSASYGGNRNQAAPLPSLDQAVVEKWKGQTKFDSINAGVVGGGVYGQRSSWKRGGRQYVAHEMQPATLFKHLFGNFTPPENSGKTASASEPEPPAYHKSVLDVVQADARELEKSLSGADVKRLDEHLSHLRDLERVLVPATDGKGTSVPEGAGCVKPDEPPGGSRQERNDQHAEIISLALACNLSRVFSFEFSPTQCTSTIKDASPAVNGDMHEMTHNPGRRPRELAPILDWTFKNFNTLVSRLRAVPEGDGNLLDNTLIFGTSEHANTQAHSYNDFPLLLVGGAGGAIKRGVHVRPTGGNANATSVMLTAMKAVGAPIDEWGGPAWRSNQTVPSLLA